MVQPASRASRLIAPYERHNRTDVHVVHLSVRLSVIENSIRTASAPLVRNRRELRAAFPLTPCLHASFQTAAADLDAETEKRSPRSSVVAPPSGSTRRDAS